MRPEMTIRGEARETGHVMAEMQRKFLCTVYHKADKKSKDKVR